MQLLKCNFSGGNGSFRFVFLSTVVCLCNILMWGNALIRERRSFASCYTLTCTDCMQQIKPGSVRTTH